MLLDEGQAALDRSQWAAAASKFAEAERLSPGNKEARRGRSIAQAYMNEGSALDDVAAETRLRRESTLAEFDAAIRNVGFAIDDGDLASARALILSALVSLDQNQDYLSAGEHRDLKRDAQGILDRIDRWEEAARLSEDR